MRESLRAHISNYTLLDLRYGYTDCDRKYFSTNTGRTKTISTTFRPEASSGREKAFSQPDEASGQNVVEIVFVRPVFVLKRLHSHHPIENTCKSEGLQEEQCAHASLEDFMKPLILQHHGYPDPKSISAQAQNAGVKTETFSG